MKFIDGDARSCDDAGGVDCNHGGFGFGGGGGRSGGRGNGNGGSNVTFGGCRLFEDDTVVGRRWYIFSDARSCDDAGGVDCNRGGFGFDGGGGRSGGEENGNGGSKVTFGGCRLFKDDIVVGRRWRYGAMITYEYPRKCTNWREKIVMGKETIVTGVTYPSLAGLYNDAIAFVKAFYDVILCKPDHCSLSRVKDYSDLRHAREIFRFRSDLEPVNLGRDGLIEIGFRW
ncbi:hypothetical protein BUALT_Bualt05G0025300 [Buddleja alternifolia]|uniref:Uncharacterized protein n=1 Tax=Buddleja alternifolia TaxID=168488 RepID=A0AAV6XG45_9LAMI|nr:hypothetical protein BUALT_Bualt05G0025300 [Buddleja alternifolia]